MDNADKTKSVVGDTDTRTERDDLGSDASGTVRGDGAAVQDGDAGCADDGTTHSEGEGESTGGVTSEGGSTDAAENGDTDVAGPSESPEPVKPPVATVPEDPIGPAEPFPPMPVPDLPGEDPAVDPGPEPGDGREFPTVDTYIDPEGNTLVTKTNSIAFIGMTRYPAIGLQWVSALMCEGWEYRGFESYNDAQSIVLTNPECAELPPAPAPEPNEDPRSTPFFNS